jgi:hypothetical protein
MRLICFLTISNGKVYIIIVENGPLTLQLKKALNRRALLSLPLFILLVSENSTSESHSFFVLDVNFNDIIMHRAILFELFIVVNTMIVLQNTDK